MWGSRGGGIARGGIGTTAPGDREGCSPAASHHAAAIRDALIDEECTEFERAYQEAIAEAAQTLDLTSGLGTRRADPCTSATAAHCDV